MASLKRKLAVLLAVCMVILSVLPAYAEGGSKQEDPNDTATSSNADYENTVIRFQNSQKGHKYDILPDQSITLGTLRGKMGISDRIQDVIPDEGDFIIIDRTGDPYDWNISINQESESDSGVLEIYTDSGMYQIDVSKTPLTIKSVGYTNEDGEIEYKECIIISGENTNFWFEPGKWYSSDRRSSVRERIINLGTEDDPAHLILADNCRLEASAGIENHSGSALIIYAGESGTGRLIARGLQHDAGIGGSEEYCSGGIFTFHGGILDATGSTHFAAIGGGRDIDGEEAGESGVITINGGTVTANGGKGAAGIGTCQEASSLGNITVCEIFDIFAGSSKKDLKKTTLEQYLKSRDQFVRIALQSGERSGSSKSNSSNSLFTGNENNPVSGTWTQDSSGVWHFTANASFRNTWGYIVNPYAKEGQNTADWFYFDANGNMLIGWQFIQGKWYYLNPSQDGTLGACQLGGVTPDGWTVDESGAWIESIARK